MGSCYIAQGTQLGALRWPRGWDGGERERGSRGKGYMYIYIVDSLCCRTETNTIKQLYANKKLK